LDLSLGAGVAESPYGRLLLGRQIFQVDIVHGMEDIPSYLFVHSIQSLKHLSNFPPFTGILRGAGIGGRGKGFFSVKSSDGF
jgi:hypothetical protein